MLATEQLEEPLLRNLLKLLMDAADPRKTVALHMQVRGRRHRPPSSSLHVGPISPECLSSDVLVLLLMLLGRHRAREL